MFSKEPEMFFVVVVVDVGENFSYHSEVPSKTSVPPGGGVAEWTRLLDFKSGGPWFKSFTLPLSEFVLSSPEFNSSTTLCKSPTGQPHTSWHS